MNPTEKSTREIPERPTTPEMNLPYTMATMFHNGLQRMAHIQKTALDLAAQQNTETVETLKKTLRVPPTTPGYGFFDFAAQAFESLVHTQKTLIDMTCAQSQAVLDYTRENGATAAKLTNHLTALANETVDRTMAAQKATLDFAAHQNRIVAETVKKQAGIAGTPAAAATETMQRNVETMIDTQKEMIDLAAKPLKTAAKA